MTRVELVFYADAEVIKAADLAAAGLPVTDPDLVVDGEDR